MTEIYANISASIAQKAKIEKKKRKINSSKMENNAQCIEKKKNAQWLVMT